MKEPFHFKDDLYAYSVDRLIKLCKADKDKADEHIRQGNIEKWLNYIGEVELCNIVNRIRTDNGNIPVQDLIKELSEHLNNRRFIELLDIDKAKETTLKEYETLRAEIIQYNQVLSQIIILPLAAIITLTGLGLTPLNDFFQGRPNINLFPRIIIFSFLIPLTSFFVIYRSFLIIDGVISISKKKYIKQFSKKY